MADTRETYEKGHKNWQFESSDGFTDAERKANVPRATRNIGESMLPGNPNKVRTEATKAAYTGGGKTHDRPVDLGSVFGGADTSGAVKTLAKDIHSVPKREAVESKAPNKFADPDNPEHPKFPIINAKTAKVAEHLKGKARNESVKKRIDELAARYGFGPSAKK